jgi:hypothetical protein
MIKYRLFIIGVIVLVAVTLSYSTHGQQQRSSSKSRPKIVVPKTALPVAVDDQAQIALDIPPFTGKIDEPTTERGAFALVVNHDPRTVGKLLSFHRLIAEKINDPQES